jgi:hypothetical protein
MKKLLLFGILLATAGLARQYSIGWSKISGGGGTSSGGQYSVSGIRISPAAMNRRIQNGNAVI